MGVALCAHVGLFAAPLAFAAPTPTLTACLVRLVPPSLDRQRGNLERSAGTSFRRWLDLPSTRGEDVLRFLREDPLLEMLLTESAGVWEEYTIVAHTGHVFDTLDGQRRFHAVDERRAGLLKLIVALHDIGKPLAVHSGDKHRQHLFTMALVEPVMASLGLEPEERALAAALIDNDVLGDVLKERCTVEEGRREIARLARRAGLGDAAFFSLLTLFFTADAGAYPALRERLFTDTAGKLELRSSRYRALAAAVAGD